MKCTSPYIGARGAFGCGQCLPCRMNRRRTWTHRLMLEAMDHQDKTFVTLTYSPKFLPSDGGLSPEHLRDWLKRFRRRIEPRVVRYFAVGEYGDETWRPHYHVALFGVKPCDYALVPRKYRRICRCPQCLDVRETWKFGHVSLDILEAKSAQYIAGYVVKKMTGRDDPRLNGRLPEFARMSLKPGIGANAMFDVASALMRLSLDGAVPSVLKIGGRDWPLGRYLRRRLSMYVGQSDEDRVKYGEDVLNRLYEELQQVRAYALAVDKSVKSVYAELNEGASRTLSAREALYKRRVI